MTAAPCLVLYGNSIFLAGLKADLRRCTRLELVTVDPGAPNAAARIRNVNPSAVIFDLTAAQPDFMIALLRDRPGLLVLGVDPSTDEMLVLSGRPERALSTQDLLQAINTLPGASRALRRLPVLSRLRRPDLAAGRPIRDRKLALVLVGIALCVVPALVVLLAGPDGNVPLVGTAAGSGGSPEIGLSFAIGIVAGGLLFTYWFWFGRRR